MWTLLLEHRIRTIWLGETINALGSGLSFWAIAWLLYRRYPDAPWVAASVLAAQGIGTMLGTVGLGAYLDHWDRRRALVAVNLVLAGLTALVVGVIESNSSPTILVCIAFALGFAGSLPQPALSASLPSFVPIEKLQALQSLFNLTWLSAGLIAPGLAGALIAASGAPRVLWLDAASFLIAVIAYSSVRFPPQRNPETSSLSLRAWWAQVRAGFGFFASRSALWGTMIGVSSVNGLFEAFNGLLLPRVSDRLLRGVRLPRWLGSDAGALGLGVFDTVVVVFELLGSVWLGSQKSVSSLRVGLRLVLLGCVGPMMGMLAVVFAPNLGLTILGCVVQGAFIALVSSVWPGVFARLVPEELRGRISSVRFFVGNTARPVVTTLSGGLLGRLSMRVLGVGITLAFVCLSVFGHVRAMRDKMLE